MRRSSRRTRPRDRDGARARLVFSSGRRPGSRAPTRRPGAGAQPGQAGGEARPHGRVGRVAVTAPELVRIAGEVVELPLAVLVLRVEVARGPPARDRPPARTAPDHDAP